jgi:cytochrome c553
LLALSACGNLRCPTTKTAKGVNAVLRLASIILLLGAVVLPNGTLSAASVEDPANSMAARLQACAACHGPQGQGTNNDYFPRLAGKPAGYLVNQLVAFKEGRRRYPPMNYLLQYQSDEYLHAIAAYFAAERPPSTPPTPPSVSDAVLAQGKALVTNGDPDRGIPACSNCHGPNLTGMEPALPGLVGLHASYISAQLGAFRYGTRTTIEPDCMQIVAGHLTEADVTAVAAYLASLPVPADPSPLPHGSLPMPLPCGSEPN